MSTAPLSIAVIVVNFRRDDDTIACLRSLAAQTLQPARVYVVDQAPASDRPQALPKHARAMRAATHMVLAENLGFAGGCNVAVDRILLELPACDAVALINNDAVAAPQWLQRMAERLDVQAGVHAVACRMLFAEDPARIDSLGITLYRSGIAANRRDPGEPLLGPCGGGALYSTALLRDIQSRFGAVFDPDYFCYAEDTALAIRARILGYDAALADDAVVLHAGSATAGGSDSEFVMYHGLRNSIMTMQRTLPAGFVFRFLPQILIVQVAIVVKYVRLGRLRLLLKVYCDAAAAWPESARARRKLARSGRLTFRHLRSSICHRIYEPTYVRAQWRSLFRSRRHAEAGR